MIVMFLDLVTYHICCAIETTDCCHFTLHFTNNIFPHLIQDGSQSFIHSCSDPHNCMCTTTHFTVELNDSILMLDLTITLRLSQLYIRQCHQTQDHQNRHIHLSQNFSLSITSLSVFLVQVLHQPRQLYTLSLLIQHKYSLYKPIVL